MKVTTITNGVLETVEIDTVEQMNKMQNQFKGMVEFCKVTEFSKEEMVELYNYWIKNIEDVINNHPQKLKIQGQSGKFLHKIVYAMYSLDHRAKMVEIWNTYIKNNDIKNMKKLAALLNFNLSCINEMDDYDNNYITVIDGVVKFI